jgi:DNA-directed RNA polymerase specialized sigma24 family protein
MFGTKRRLEAAERAQEYATRNDFAAIFNDDMSTLHTLALLLTADHAKAEECFVAGLEESIQGNPVFRQWARSWSKRVVIKHAIKMMLPAPGQINPSPAVQAAMQVDSETDALMSVVWELPPFERFVFVISVLEGHSVSDCASLLGCTLTELSRARSQALTQIALARGVGAAAPQSRTASPIRFMARPELA